MKAATYAQGAGIRQGNNWPYLVLSLAVAALVAVYELPPTNPLVPIRWVLASLLAVFLPGYATVQLLFSGKVLENTERYAFSIGLGFALLGLIGLILNYTPWGIEATSVVTSLFVYTLLLALIALYRRC